MSKVSKLLNYNKCPGPLAIPAQMTERIQNAQREGREVHVVATVAEKQASGFYSYHPYWDTQPREIMAWMAYGLLEQAHTVDDEDPDPEVA